jgi:hypothetical protein
MKLLKLAAAAAVLVTTIGVTAAAEAQPPMRERTVVRTNGDRTVVRTRTVVRDDRGVRDDRDRMDRGDRMDRDHMDRGRHYGWQRGRHNGWANQNRRTCRVVWRHHHRERICRTVRWR